MSFNPYEVAGDPEFQRAYAQWLADPFTQRMAEMTRKMMSPTALQTVTGESALYMHGLTCGGSAMHTALFDLVDAVAAVRKTREDQKILNDPDFVMTDILKEQGYIRQ